MAKISLIINIILIIAIGFLFYHQFSGKKESSEQEKVMKAIKDLPDSTSIVYINTDTLLHKYKFYKELEKKVTAKQQTLENELSMKASAFEKEAA